MDPLPNYRSSAHRSRRKALLFCQHPVAQERFLRLLSRAGFDIAPHAQLRQLSSEAVNSKLAVVDCSDLESSRQ